MLMKERRGAAILWCVQGDAAAGVEAEAKVDGGGGAPKDGQRKEEDEVQRYGGGMERPPGPIYKGKKIIARRENRGAQNLDMRRSCRLDCRRLVNEGRLYTVLNNR